MREDPNVSIDLDPNRTFVEAWVFTRPLNFQNALLAHEQGHYEIGMLNAGDFFIALQEISSGAFASPGDGVAAVRNLNNRLGNDQPIQDKYDSDTNHGLIPGMQAAWITALSNARVTFARPSLRVALANARLFP